MDGTEPEEGLDNEILQEFLVESFENLAQLDLDLVALEEAPDDGERLRSVFRTVHTIKGVSGFLGFEALERVAHAGESLLARVRDGELALTAPRASALFALVDVVKAILTHIEGAGREGERDDSELITLLDTLTRGEPAPAPVEPPATPAAAEPAAAAIPEEATAAIPEEAVAAVHEEAAAALPEAAAPAVPVPEAVPEAVSAPVAAAPVVAESTTGSAEAVPAGAGAPGSTAPVPEVTAPPQPARPQAPAVPAPAGATTPSASGSQGVAPQAGFSLTGPARAPAEAAGPGQSRGTEPEPARNAGPATENRPGVADAHVRVDVGVLDEMMDLVGELVLARNQILQHVSSQSDSPLTAPTQRLNLITSELQERVMKTRMQPILNVWSLFPRTVRDLAVACGKQVRLELEGQDTELDRTIIEAIRNPLTHLVRNSVDHGIELPEDRLAAGKPAQGRLLLRAFHEGGRVNIEMIDDGAGIDIERVRRTAVERRLVSAEKAAALTDREVVDLLFVPGFSTAPAVTNISGRGVGMDVVKTNIEKIGGVIDITTVAGQGTSVTIKIPLTLAIIPALLVTSGGQRYALPQVNLLELVRLDESTESHVEYVGGVPVYRLRGRLLPLVDLAEQLGGPPTTAGETTIVVVQSDGQAFGLIVDDVHDTEEIVVKPLGEQLKGIPALAGVTIMGDGRVALILDVTGLAHQAGLTAGGEQALGASAAGQAEAQVDGTTVEPLLLVRVGGSQLALPQVNVDRIEEVAANAVERAGDYDAVQYRGTIMPLVHLRDYVAGGTGDGEGATSLQVVVVNQSAGQRLGLVVDNVVDIVEGYSAPVRSTARLGTLGSAIVAGQITDVVDIDALGGGHGGSWGTVGSLQPGAAA